MSLLLPIAIQKKYQVICEFNLQQQTRFLFNEDFFLLPSTLPDHLTDLITALAQMRDIKVKKFHTDQQMKIQVIKNGQIYSLDMRSYQDYLKLNSLVGKINIISNQEDLKVFKDRLKKHKVFITYIPPQNQYDDKFSSLDIEESFEKTYKLNLGLIRKNFEKFKNDFTPNDMLFYIVDSEEMIKSIGMSDKVGELYLIEQPSVFNNHSKNLRIDNQLWNFHRLGDKILTKDKKSIKNELSKKFKENTQQIKSQWDIEVFYRYCNYLDLDEFIFYENQKNDKKIIHKVNQIKGLTKVMVESKELFKQLVNQKGFYWRR